MKTSSLLGHCAQLLKIIRKSPHPADALTSDYMRERKYIGSKERRAVSEIVFSILRRLILLDFHVEVTCSTSHRTDVPDEVLVVAAGALLLYTDEFEHLDSLLRAASNDAEDIPSAIAQLLIEKGGLDPTKATECIAALQASIAQRKNEILTSDTPWIDCSMPEWMFQNWCDYYGRDSAIENANTVLNGAPLTVRVNTMIGNREKVLTALQNDGFDCTATPYSPHGIIFARRVQLHTHPLMQHGIIEVQDEGSQLVGFALSPHEEWSVLDACAGAGGKSLHCAVLQNDKGAITGSDIEPRRLRELYHRSQRAHLKSIRCQSFATLKPDERSSLFGTFDAVIIDAPCSGIGTIRRSPMLKYRVNPNQLERIAAKQRSIISDYARYVKPGGILLYVTCSLMHEENADVVSAFLSSTDEFIGDDLRPVFEQHGIGIDISGESPHCVTLLPYQHGTDGFFIARMKRIH
ncbi:MAG: hypothetical protein JNL32_01795 [Candidatus Kapabacteria bacterium]|nr:hypothetical protein [Candidatus Kapabacteria bacterium]